ncbi:uncharacterized protein LOC119302034 [Triticum dicoccoides]|uniref:uncharacterized protein LOC119291741 n=1 Tax=Triticum dicoccoides TaxID=85692 RepID=UPI00188FE631|nr:uncharacterized protein LOC119291741 [Triticum dicoccoides]XP_037426461.1 uncharacterized protein LOC119291741 [Triticum dicoccoides]XP_037434942.1 uncharacterized protein LOC119302034 [Triticum dicoccoides]XP_037434943.1 uncharacterized protein LOC119302034 [Triticum dicoccoides]XP_037434944.1 uncharacterized protein LOC119302034 [Triticum dicoccoides]
MMTTGASAAKTTAQVFNQVRGKTSHLFDLQWLNALVALVEILKLYEAPWIEFASKRITQPDSTGSSLFLPNCSIDAYQFAGPKFLIELLVCLKYQYTIFRSKGTELCAVFQLNAAPNGFVTVERQYTPHSQL